MYVWAGPALSKPPKEAKPPGKGPHPAWRLCLHTFNQNFAQSDETPNNSGAQTFDAERFYFR